MSIDQILGYSKAILDTYGVTQIITVILVVAVAFYLYNRFFNRGE